MIDVVGAVGVEVAQRIVGERGQMHHRVEADQRVHFDFAQIGPERRHAGEAVTEIATGEILGVETDDLVSGRVKRGNEDGPDIPGVARDQNLHRISNPSTALRT